MIAEHRVVTPFRVFLVLLFGILLVFQTLSLPGGFAHMAQESPRDAYLRWPLTAISVFWVLCVQVVIVSTWQLLTMVKNDRIFTQGVIGVGGCDRVGHLCRVGGTPERLRSTSASTRMTPACRCCCS